MAVPADGAERDQHHEVDRDHDRRDREHEQDEHALGVRARAFLLGEEVHRRFPCANALS